ncbi:sec13 protein [Naegleria gruberi]|uniref:Sec13 protein n=1 Tax=Naegleria gruberi TaxID=5762 RepID=D2V6F0_NAEGR|nr:sec13 protein [Naegleria gruberi]EFC47435.1 sec13 protein [Naegleria gruberi]|eukprot:XP_002680179.1 sec13 protein [Naegleria gruberi]
MSASTSSHSTAPIKTFSSEHQDMIHDAQADYYGKRLATCSSDATIRIFDLAPSNSEEPKLVDTLIGHEGPVWQVSWAHPQFGSIIASCSYDHRVIIWKENQQTHKFTKVFEYRLESSVNSISWAPHEHGLHLASASSDSQITFFSYDEQSNNWKVSNIRDAHKTGCNSVCWAPASHTGALVQQSSQDQPENLKFVKRIVSGGSDKLVKIWEFNESSNQWQIEAELEGHDDWVRDVSWAPNIGLPYETIASCSQDKRVIIWTRDQNSNQWSKQILPFENVVWRVSWSLTGNILAISTADNEVTLWKEDVNGSFQKISSLSDK